MPPVWVMDVAPLQTQWQHQFRQMDIGRGWVMRARAWCYRSPSWVLRVFFSVFDLGRGFWLLHEKVPWASVLWSLSVLLTVVESVWMVSHPAPPHPWLAWYLCLHCHPGGASMQRTAQVPVLSLWPALHSAHISVLFLRSVLEAVPFWVLTDTQLWLIPAKGLCYARMLLWVHLTPWRPYETITSIAAYVKGRTLKQREEKLLLQDHSGPGGKHSFRLQMPELHWLIGPVNLSIVVGFS